jgi:hypothetical protein
MAARRQPDAWLRDRNTGRVSPMSCATSRSPRGISRLFLPAVRIRLTNRAMPWRGARIFCCAPLPRSSAVRAIRMLRSWQASRRTTRKRSRASAASLKQRAATAPISRVGGISQHLFPMRLLPGSHRPAMAGKPENGTGAVNPIAFLTETRRCMLQRRRRRNEIRPAYSELFRLPHSFRRVTGLRQQAAGVSFRRGFAAKEFACRPVRRSHR